MDQNSFLRALLGILIAIFPVISLYLISILAGSSLDITWFEGLYILGLVISGTLASIFFNPKVASLNELRIHTFISFLIPFLVLSIFQLIDQYRIILDGNYLLPTAKILAVTAAGAIWFWYLWFLLYGYFIQRLKINPWLNHPDYKIR